MHAIVRDDQYLKDARQDLLDARASQRVYAEKVQAARVKYGDEQRAALDRGEVHSPRLEVIDDEAVRGHLQQRQDQAGRNFTAAGGVALRRLTATLEEREQELLGSVGRLKVSELQRVAAEVADLATAKQYLRTLATWRSYSGEPPVEPVQQVTVTPAQVLQAALDGGSVIGREPAAPEPVRVVEMTSPEGDAVMSGADGAGGRAFA